MAKGIILGAPGELADPEAITQSELDRAAEAVANAPMTEHGIVIPPHVAEEQAAAAAPGPNRAQRRAEERHKRRQDKKLRRYKPEDRAALEGIREATERLSPAELEQARFIMEGATDREDLIERLQGNIERLEGDIG